MPEVAVAEKPQVRAKNPAFEKFAEPKTIHEHYVNNLFDAAKKFYDAREDVPLKERADFYSLISTLAADEKVSTVSRKTMILEREAIPMFESYLEKMGPEKTKEFFQKYAVEGKKNSNDEIVIKSRVSEFTELVTVKKLGMEKEFNDIVKGAFNKAVDDVSAKRAQEKDVVANEQASVLPTEARQKAATLVNGKQ